MAYEIQQRKVAGVVMEANRALMGKDFNHGEIILGLSELMGRIIASASGTKIQSDELVKVALTHLEATIRIGTEAQGNRIITGV